MKTDDLSYPGKLAGLALGLVLGAIILAFSATQSRADTDDIEEMFREDGYAAHYYAHPKRYRYYRHYHPRNRLYWGYGPGYVFQHFGLGPRYYPRRYHRFYDPFYHPYGYGYGGVGFAVRIR